MRRGKPRAEGKGRSCLCRLRRAPRSSCRFLFLPPSFLSSLPSLQLLFLYRNLVPLVNNFIVLINQIVGAGDSLLVGIDLLIKAGHQGVIARRLIARQQLFHLQALCLQGFFLRLC